ncbi:MAG: tetratricopeptide repeat protein [Deltaproteobacteria bacterium]|nr:tetratricopeptide repeat protein [Deltaproteobacteria bacterium]
MQSLRKNGIKGLYAAALIGALTLLIYSNTFHSSFQFDDYLYVINYCKAHPLKDYWPPYGTRYLTYLSFAMNYRLGGLDPFGYHAVNTLIHAINGLLAFGIITAAFRTPVMAHNGKERGLPFAVALAASLIFVAHPVQTEAVTYVSQRFASLATLFYLLSLFLYARWRDSGQGERYLFYIGSILSAFLAQKTKEIAFTLPFVIALYEFVFFGGERPGRRILRLVPFFLAFLIIPLSVLGFLGGGGIGDEIRGLQLKDLSTISRHDYLLTQFRVIVTYLRLLVLPVNQNIEYDYPMSTSALDPRVVLSFLFLLAVFLSAAYALYISAVRKKPLLLLASFGVVWFFVTVSIESSIIPIKDVIFEHRLYLPSFGAALAFSAAAFYAAKKIMPAGDFIRPAVIIILLTAVPLGAATYRRNSVWENEVTLYEDAVRKSPDKERVRYNLAWAYQTRGQTDKAVTQYIEDLRLDPKKEKAHYNIAVIYQTGGKGDEALRHFAEAVKLNPANAIAYYNMALIYQARGDTKSAILSNLQAVNINPGYEDAHYNLAWAYNEAGDDADAAAHFKEVIRLNPKSADAFYNLGLIYRKEGRTEDARDAFTAALRIKPDYAQAGSELKGLTSVNAGHTRR